MSKADFVSLKNVCAYVGMSHNDEDVTALFLYINSMIIGLILIRWTQTPHYVTDTVAL